MNLEEKANYVTPGINQIQVEMYGFGKELRKYCFLPSGFPLRIKSQHGIVLWNNPSLHELNSELPFMLVFSKRHQLAWEKISKKPCFIIPHPFYLYRTREKIQLRDDRSGSLFFLSHSTFSKETDINFVQIINQLENLPEEFKPVTVCLHFVDVLKDKHLLFEKAGFECVTAGHMFNKDFISNFYEILIRFKYSLSNDVGSHTFYSIELGIPFSLVCDSARISITEAEELENALLKKSLAFQGRIEEMIVRNKLNYQIIPQIKEIVLQEMGIYEGISKVKLGVLLIVSSIVYFIMMVTQSLFK